MDQGHGFALYTPAPDRFLNGRKSLDNFSFTRQIKAGALKFLAGLARYGALGFACCHLHLGGGANAAGMGA